MPRKQRAVNPVQVQEQARSVLSSIRHRDIDQKTAVQVAKKLDPVTGANWMKQLSEDAALKIDDCLLDIAEKANAVMLVALQAESWVVPESVQASRDKAAARKAEEAERVQKIKETADERRRQQFEEAQGRREAQRRGLWERRGRDPNLLVSR